MADDKEDIPMLFVQRQREYSETSSMFNLDDIPLDEPDDTTISKETVPEPKAKYVIQDLEAVAVASILEDACNELAILGKIGDLPDVEIDINYKTLEEKYSTPYRIHIFDPETIEPIAIAMARQRVVKFQKDREYVLKLLRETKMEMLRSMSFDCLMKRLMEYQTEKEEEEELLNQMRERRSQLTELQMLLEVEKVKTLDKIQMATEAIGRLKDELEGTKIENEIKGGYVNDWEDARTESNTYQLDSLENGYKDTIKHYTTEIEREERIHSEMKKYLTEMISEQEEQILQWMDNYDKEIESRDTEIQILKEKREEQFMNLENLAKLYEQHKKEIEDYLVVKEKRRQEHEKQQAMIRACIRIQAWWRGTMVRKCLGPYRKKKKGKKGKDKKGKK